MGLTESICGGFGFDDIHNIYTLHPVLALQNVLANPNNRSGMVSFLGTAVIIIVDNQIVIFLNAS